MAQYVLKVFEDEDHLKFRVVDREGEPWFVLSDVCRRLEIKNVADAAGRLDDDERMTIAFSDSHSLTRGGARQLTIISESGLYSLILRSNKPEAKNFRKWVTGEVLPSIRKVGHYGRGMPAFIRRANDNWDRVERGYFSVINELAVIVWGRLERVGHIMAHKAPDGRELRPDVSVGQRFAKWLDDHHPSQSCNYKTYRHRTAEVEVNARQYPYSMLHLFREYVEAVWWPNHFEDYVRHRDPKALMYLQKLLPPTRKAS
jgi:prophage antirepressor-like protein